MQVTEVNKFQTVRVGPRENQLKCLLLRGVELERAGQKQRPEIADACAHHRAGNRGVGACRCEQLCGEGSRLPVLPVGGRARSKLVVGSTLFGKAGQIAFDIDEGDRGSRC